MASKEHHSLKIEGDFVDSFIYSGTLFLVHADSKITTHNWESLLDRILDPFDIEQSSIGDFLKDCRKESPNQTENQTIYIDAEQLDNCKVCELVLNEWPTDINIYSNRLYIANENGVKEYKFDYRSRIIDNSTGFTIYNKYAYKISPNDGHRLAIAAGQNGIIAAYPRNGYVKERDDITLLLEENANDCEWIGINLAANTTSGGCLFTFPALPDRPAGNPTQEYWDKFNTARKSPPSFKKINNENDERIFIWSAGRKNFILHGKSNLILDIFDNLGHSEQHELPIDFLKKELDSPKSKIISARTGLFGTAIELGDILFAITDKGVETISNRPVSWRLFPRARNYVNHMHIIEDDHILIRAYIPDYNPQESNKFGINFDEVT